MSKVPQHDQQYLFLEKMKARLVVSVRELTSAEILLAEELVYEKLLSKNSTSLDTFYFYGVADDREDSNG